MPLSLLNDAFRAVTLDGSSLTSILPAIGGLAAWSVVSFTCTVKFFRWT
jgi:hypothetical protein